MIKETFDHHQIIHAIRAFLKYGEDSYGKSHMGYFSISSGGFAARALRFHLESLQKKMDGERPNDEESL